MATNLRDPHEKLKHLDACLLESSQYSRTSGLERYHFLNEAGAPLSLQDIDLTTTFCGAELAAPLMILPMTGGVERGGELNRMWAVAAERFGLAMGVGSQRVAIEQGDKVGFGGLRAIAPNAYLFANLGAANLTRANATDLAKRAVAMIEANALFIHFNAMQEACQKSGDTDFREVLQTLEMVCSALQKDGVKVFAREVGFGLSEEATRRFINAGVDGIDCTGVGGTSWSKVEALCCTDDEGARLGRVFGEWGIPTADSILNVRRVSADVPLVAGGGLRTGLDLAKALALGANLAGMARPMLLAATQGEEALHRFIEGILLELRVAMFAAGFKSVAELSRAGTSALRS